MAFLFLLLACHHSPPPVITDEHGGEMARLSRSPCYGTCPIYDITVYQDGWVVYRGMHYVKVEGEATRQLTDAELQELRHLFLDNNYFKMKDHYLDYQITDMPSADTAFSDGKRAKVVLHYYGDSSAPRELSLIEEGFDRIVGSEQWVGTYEERKKLLESWQ